MGRNLTPDSELKRPRRYRIDKRGKRPDRLDMLVRVMPGPHSGKVKLPEPSPHGVMPPEDSRLWMFIPRAVQQGEAFIQDDTREWFDAKGGFAGIQIRRDYPDHPRWIVKGNKWLKDSIVNAGIASEVHMLARIMTGLPDLPKWVPARMAIKQQQADLAYRLTKMTRQVLIEKGAAAMSDFATRAPGQFLKFVAATFIPKKTELAVEHTKGSLDPEVADGIIDVLKQELLRREREAAITKTVGVLDYEPGADAPLAMERVVEDLREAAGTDGPRAYAATALAAMGESELTHGLKHVVDIMSPENEETVEWD